MKFPDLLGRRGLAQQVEQVTTEVRALADKTQTLAEKTQTLAEAAEESRQEDELHKDTQPPPSEPMAVGAGRLLRLIWFCLICFTGAFVTGTFVPAAFTDPPAFDDPYSPSLEISMPTTAAESESATPFATSDPVVVTGLYNQVSEPIYKISFPQEYLSKRFVLLIYGTAVMGSVRATDPTGEIEIRLDSHIIQCGYYIRDEWRPSGDRCQVIYGVVPSRPDPVVSSSNDPLGCEKAKVPKSGSASIELSGEEDRAQVPYWDSFIRDLDWAHQSISMPGIEADTSPGVVNEFQGFNLGSRYGSVPMRACKKFEVSDDSRIGDVNLTPTNSDPGLMVWDGAAGVPAVTVVTTERNAGGLGNLLLASAGALAALSIGFVPVAYEEWGRWRRYRKSLRSPPTDGPVS
jgi:hypothetical protein